MPKLSDEDERDRTELDGAPQLRIYVASHCLNCEEAVRLANIVSHLFPHLIVEVVDLDQTSTQALEVFAVPTYVLNGRVCFLGNPSEEELCDFLARGLSSGGRV